MVIEGLSGAKRRGIVLSEIIIHRIIKEENLVTIIAKQRKYNSNLGEITPEEENVISRNFHADWPYEKPLTDIAEFVPSTEKSYLSAIIDCFDRMAVGWTIGARPNTDLVSTMWIR